MKLWGLPCRRIDADWTAGRIYRESLFRTLRGLISSEDGVFRYPRRGSRQLYDLAAEDVRRRGQTILLNSAVSRIEHDGKRIERVWVTDSEGTVSHRCKAMITSIPLPALLSRLSPRAPESITSAAARLRFRNTVLVYLFIRATGLFADNCIYVNDPRAALVRVTNFANWSPGCTRDGITPLCCEYLCDFQDDVWNMADDELENLAIADLRTMEVLHSEEVADVVVKRLPTTHPCYCDNYRATLGPVECYLGQFENLRVIGRCGSFNYYDQDNVLLMGIRAANEVAAAITDG